MTRALLVALLALTTAGAAQTVLLVPVSTTDSVQMLDPATGADLGVLIPSDPTHLSTPIDCEVNATGVLVSDQIDDHVVQYDFTGAFVAIHASPIDNLRGIAARAGVLYTTAGNTSEIPTFDLDTGASLGLFIASGGGGLNSPFDILFRVEGDVLITSINSDQILRYDLTGAFLSVFATNILFGEQMHQAANLNILVADFTRNAVIELSPMGVELGVLTGAAGCRGVYELPGGNILTTNSSGVHELDRTVGGIVATHFAGGSCHYIQEVTLTPPPPPPTCVLTPPAAPASGSVVVSVDAASTVSAAVDLIIELSTDAGATFVTATMDPTSPNPNPLVGAPLGVSDFLWDSLADGVGIAAVATGVVLRATVDDGSNSATCSDTTDVDNTALCTGVCGDCDSSGAGPSILDALVGAQIAAGLVAPTPAQLACCDVNSSGAIEILDSLLMAQDAAGLPVVVACP